MKREFCFHENLSRNLSCLSMLKRSNPASKIFFIFGFKTFVFTSNVWIQAYKMIIWNFIMKKFRENYVEKWTSYLAEVKWGLNFCRLHTIEADIKSNVYLETELGNSFKLSSISIKCQTLFSWKHMKNTLKYCLLKLKIREAKVNNLVTHISVFQSCGDVASEWVRLPNEPR